MPTLHDLNIREDLPVEVQFNSIEEYFHHKIKHNNITASEEFIYYQFSLYANYINKGMAVSFYKSTYNI